MLEAITKRLKRLKSDKRGVSNVLVLMLSLALMVVIVSNVVLWSYQMNQLDWEKTQENLKLVNAESRFHWLENENLLGTFTEENTGGSVGNYSFYPSNYSSLGSTQYVDGSLSDLQTNNDVYMTFRSYGARISEITHYVGQQSDVDSSADKGTHSNFNASKDTDNVFNNLTEGIGSYAPISYVTSTGGVSSATGNASYVGSPINISIGHFVLIHIAISIFPFPPPTVSSFTFVSSNATATATLLAGPVDRGYVRSYLYYYMATTSLVNAAPTLNLSTSTRYAWTLVVYSGVDPSNPFSGYDDNTGSGLTPQKANVTVSVAGNLVVSAVAAMDNEGADGLISISPAAGETERVERNLSGSTWGYRALSSQIQDFNTTTAPRTNQAWCNHSTSGRTLNWIMQGVTLHAIAYYELDLEAQWVNVDYTKTSKFLCIKTGEFNTTEPLKVDVWTGSSWVTVMSALSANSWNNVSVPEYLTSSNFTIRFKASVETEDAEQSSWQIDSALLWLWDDLYTVEVEFTGTSNTESWTQLVWTVDSAWTVDSVSVTLQLYNYEANSYPTSGDGYISYTSGSANTDETKTQTITTNPTRFKDADGNWKLKVKGVKTTSTQFDFKVDWIELRVETQSETYTLAIAGDFVLNLTEYPIGNISSIEVHVRFRASDSLEDWLLEAYNWMSGQFENIGGLPPARYFKDYIVNFGESWQNYVNSNGTIKLVFYDEKPDNTQTTVDIDSFAVKVILKHGAVFTFKNEGASTVHIVSIWVIDASSHTRYNADFFINSGETATYAIEDIDLPSGGFTVRVVTERGNVAVISNP